VHHRSCWCVGGDVGACRCRLTKCGCSARRCTAAKLRGGGGERRHNGDFIDFHSAIEVSAVGDPNKQSESFHVRVHGLLFILIY
jgi:hypothetical protein